MSDIDERLRRLGERLDREAPPITEAEVVGGTDDVRVHPRRRWVVPASAAASIVLVLAVVAASTRDGDRSKLVTTPASPRATTTSASPPTTEAPSTSTVPAAGTDASTTSTTADEGPALPGERQDVYPYEGARLAVVGVATDDELNVRAGPGTEYPVVLTLDPLFDDATATGHNRLLPGRGYWSEIRAGDRSGWVSTAFVLQPGQVDDVTSRLYPAGDERPSGTLARLATAVAARAAQDPEARPKVVIVDGPREGDLGEVVVDVIGLRDDSVGGLRLRIFASREGSGAWTVRDVEQVTLCSRAVTGEGLCV